jgi:hypothetical protein
VRSVRSQPVSARDRVTQQLQPTVRQALEERLVSAAQAFLA